FGGRYNYSGAEPDDAGIRKHIRNRMLKVFPSLENLKIDYAWSGNVAVTMNRIPQLGKLDRNIFYAQGYSGHGVAPTHAAAEIISNGIVNEDKSLNILNRVPHVQLPGGKWFSSPAMAIGMMYYQFRDLLSNYIK
ncbi:MAG TPA: FAD-binding oxidoreductase, partial [Gammaproteobacteria bacterium]|nr:FAD-binding oxidoreductase [Gammaproteobacteria bacterium]